jgi:hypothetical protein
MPPWLHALRIRTHHQLARQIIADTAIRSDGDARLLQSLAWRLLDRVGAPDDLLSKDSAAGEAVPTTDSADKELPF